MHFAKTRTKQYFFLISSKCTQPFHPFFSPFLLFLAVAFHYQSWNTWKQKVTNSLFLQQLTWRIYGCEIYLGTGSRKIRKLDLFFFILIMPCPKSGWFCLCVCFYLGEIILIFEVMIEKAENTIKSLMKLFIIIIKRDL